jgi:acetyltransferase-like isoleucine patch superfamily enzyme
MKRVVAFMAAIPVLLLILLLRSRCLAFTTGSRALALVPGFMGVWWRRQWYERTLERCGVNLYVDWMAAFKTARARVGDRVFVGTFCWLGEVQIGDDVMLGGHITVLSGARHHNFDRVDVPMNAQRGSLSHIRIGNDVWVGDGSIIMADVATGSVVGAGSVVTRVFEPFSVLAGVPATLIRRRGADVTASAALDREET